MTNVIEKPSTPTYFPLAGRIIIQADLRLLTGLHIGGKGAGIEVGGVNGIIRNPLTNQPYIPGSSLRGKIRSLLEKYTNMPFNYPIQGVKIHSYKEGAPASEMTDICYIFGIASDTKTKVARPTRLIVRDATDISFPSITESYNEALAVEAKIEVAIDRVTSAAVPRTLERVSAGLVFSNVEFVFNIYTQADYERLRLVLLGLRLLEDDYLGGSGSRGSGRVGFERLRFSAKKAEPGQYQAVTFEDKDFPSLEAVNDQAVIDWVKTQIQPDAKIAD